jgi:hypothetical protein
MYVCAFFSRTTFAGRGKELKKERLFKKNSKRWGPNSTLISSIYESISFCLLKKQRIPCGKPTIFGEEKSISQFLYSILYLNYFN